MDYTNASKEEFNAFLKMERDGPIQMLNLVQLRKKAIYEDGRDATGAEAYEAYGRETAPCLKAVGGKIVWSGRFEMMLIGPKDEQWDKCFIAQYPSVSAFIQMMKDPAYKQSVAHRQAAVKTSRLVRFMPLDTGDSF